MDGTWERLNAELRERLRSRQAGSKPQRRDHGFPVRKDHERRWGAHNAKKVCGRKKHLLVDIQGLFARGPSLHSAKVQRYTTRMASGCWSRRVLGSRT